MRRNKKTGAVILMAMLGAGMLSGCGSAQIQAADTRRMVEVLGAAADTDTRGDLNSDGKQDVTDAQLLMRYYVSNSLSSKPLTWAELLEDAPAQDPKDADKKAVEALMKKFLDATVAGDAEQVFKLSGMGDLLRMSSGTTKTDAELLEDPSIQINKIDSYTIGEVTEEPEKLKEYQDAYETAMVNVRKAFGDTNASAQELRTAYMAATVLKPVTKLYSCPVTTTRDGKESSGTIMVACDDRGEWRVDLGVQTSLNRYNERSRKASANSTASKLQKALTSAIVDFDEMGMDVNVFDGDYTWTGAEVKTVGAVSYDVKNITKENAALMLKAQLLKYFDKAGDLVNISFRVKNGSIVAAAAEMHFSSGNVIGVYPQIGDVPADMTVTEAMLKSAGLHGE